MKRVVFLFNHDAPHQVAHLAGPAAAFAAAYPAVQTIIAYATPRIRTAIEALVPSAASRLVEWHELTLPSWAPVASKLDKILPASRLLRLRTHLPLFAGADILVSTERTCLRLKNYLPPDARLRFVRVPHGAGDRNVTYHPDFQRFDMVFASGQKAFNELAKAGVAPQRIRIVGYPKFDAVDLDTKRTFFGNDRPVFVYNPHFDPHLSSWYKAGPDLLRWFANPQGQQFNLIFAPHVMLFRKTLHISPEYRVARRRPDVPVEALSATNILIDTDGPRLFDMSYMLAATGYIGDFSSQIYEFLLRPRAAFFLDLRGGAKDDEDARHVFRQAGPVLNSPDELTAALPSWHEVGASYQAAQEALFERTFSRTGEPANQRAAAAIAELLDEGTSV
jgi:hypothetical protein